MLYPSFLDQHRIEVIQKLAAPKLEQSRLGVGRFTTEAVGQDVRIFQCPAVHSVSLELSAVVSSRPLLAAN